MPWKLTTKLMALKLAGAMAIGAIMTGTAAAQLPMPGLSLGKDKPPPTPEEIERQKQIDNAYKSATSKIPNQTGAAANDPWGGVRPAPAPGTPPKKKPQ
jgi:hypothetical protein